MSDAQQNLEFWSWKGRFGRVTYAVIGFVCTETQYRSLACAIPSRYVGTLELLDAFWRNVPCGSYSAKEQELAKAVFLVAIPFAWIAVTFTVKGYEMQGNRKSGSTGKSACSTRALA